MKGRLRFAAILLVPAFAGFATEPPPSSAPDGLRERCVSVALTPLVIELTPASRARGASGSVELVFAGSPFGTHVTADGRYVYDLRINAAGLRPPTSGVFVAWAATADLSEAINLGTLDADLSATGTVEWNQFLVFVTLEEAPGGQTWNGPIFLSGISPSSRMHTMAGHGIFEQHTALC